jgi:predicted ArsR family transcriptional regulator
VHALGSIDLPGTPTSPAPKNEGRPRGFVTDRITALLMRPQGATCLEISAALGITPDQASKRLSRLKDEQRRKGLARVTSQRTGHGNTLRYQIREEDDEA